MAQHYKSAHPEDRARGINSRVVGRLRDTRVLVMAAHRADRISKYYEDTSKAHERAGTHEMFMARENNLGYALQQASEDHMPSDELRDAVREELGVKYPILQQFLK